MKEPKEDGHAYYRTSTYTIKLYAWIFALRFSLADRVLYGNASCWASYGGAEPVNSNQKTSSDYLVRTTASFIL